MTKRIENPKWILYRHTRDFELLCTTAEFLKSYSKTTISKEEKTRLNNKLREVGLYNERNPDLPLDAISHKINQLSYYMFGYQYGSEKRFLFSPLGNLLLKYKEYKSKCATIFLTMLWAVQYPHPHGGTINTFQIYPFRLIYKLLLDSRLHYKLYAYEVAYLVVFMERLTEQTYENLILSIQKLRKLNNEQLTEKFQKDSHVYVNSAYEWDYYVSNLFCSAGVLEKTEGEIICKLQHGTTPTYRSITRNEVTIPSILRQYVTELERHYSAYSTPLKLDDPERLKIDVVKEIYNFYPLCLLAAIGEKIDDRKYELLSLPKLIEQYANNQESRHAYLFEDALVDGFNLFYNVEAEKVGGAGNTDIECLFLTQNRKFAVDAKSTKNKLLGINAGRLASHRIKIGGQYTIVITPRYVPAVINDIQNNPIVIIRANTFAEYLYNCIENDVRDIDYGDFDSLITSNFGKDISKNISDLTIERFATKK